MPKRRAILLASGIVGLLLTVFAFATHKREPTYRGYKLSDWVRKYRVIQHQPASNRDPGGPEAAEAIRHIGTNAIPFLRAWIRVDFDLHTGPEQTWSGVINAFPGDLRPWAWRILADTNEPLCTSVPNAFGALGAEGRSAIPALARLARDTNDYQTAEMATEALGRIGRDSLPALLDLLSSQDDQIRRHAGWAVCHVGKDAGPAIPILVGNLRRYGDAASAIALGQLAMQPDLVVPALTERLVDHRAYVRAVLVRALGRFGTNAQSTVPTLVAALSDHSREVREATTNALRQIVPTRGDADP